MNSLGSGRRVVIAVFCSEVGVDALVGDVFFVVEGADVGGHECFDAVSESSRGFGERYAAAEPSGRGCVSAVVDPRRFLADRFECPVPGACPVRSAWAGVVAGPEQQPIWRDEVVRFDPLALDRYEYGRYWDAARPGFGSPGSSKDISASVTSRRPQPSAGRSADRTRSMTTSDGRRPA